MECALKLPTRPVFDLEVNHLKMLNSGRAKHDAKGRVIYQVHLKAKFLCSE